MSSGRLSAWHENMFVLIKPPLKRGVKDLNEMVRKNFLFKIHNYALIALFIESGLVFLLHFIESKEYEAKRLQAISPKLATVESVAIRIGIPITLHTGEHVVRTADQIVGSITFKIVWESENPDRWGSRRIRYTVPGSYKIDNGIFKQVDGDLAWRFTRWSFLGGSRVQDQFTDPRKMFEFIFVNKG